MFVLPTTEFQENKEKNPDNQTYDDYSVIYHSVIPRAVEQ